jgi:hypothetical protein
MVAQTLIVNDKDDCVARAPVLRSERASMP